jgi:hypothetical protein
VLAKKLTTKAAMVQRERHPLVKAKKADMDTKRIATVTADSATGG